jgi:hypothetical protein
VSAIPADLFPTKPRLWIWIGPIALAFLMAFGMLASKTKSAGGGAEFCADSAYMDSSGNHFPDETCTGWEPTGVTLTTWASSCTLSTPNTTYDSQRFNCDILINANNITIKRSEVNGAIDDNADHSGLVVEDTLIDCGNNDIQGIGHAGSGLGEKKTSVITITRVNVQNCSWGFYAGIMTIADSYCHDLWGEGLQHNECLLGEGPGPHRVSRSTFDGTYNAATTGGEGVSAPAVFYTHGSSWADIDDVIFNGNYLLSADANTGMYIGFDQIDGMHITNAQYYDNVFATGQAYGTNYVSDFNIGSATNCWGPNNRTSAGTAITTGALPTCF